MPVFLTPSPSVCCSCLGRVPGSPVCPAGLRGHQGAAGNPRSFLWDWGAQPLGRIFTLKDLPVLSLVLHPVCRCLQMFAVTAEPPGSFRAGDQGAAPSTGTGTARKGDP